MAVPRQLDGRVLWACARRAEDSVSPPLRAATTGTGIVAITPPSLRPSALARRARALSLRSDTHTSLDLDNELEDAQFFPRSVVARVATSKGGSKFTKDDYQQLDKATNEPDANAPSTIDPNAQFDNFTKIPPATAIAGVLMRQWALGTHATHLVSSL